MQVKELIYFSPTFSISFLPITNYARSSSRPPFHPVSRLLSRSASRSHYFASFFATSLLLCWGLWYRARAKKQVEGGAARWTCREDQKLTEEMVDGREGDRWALILFYCACFLMKEFYNINLKKCGVSGACAFMVININLIFLFR